MQVSTLILHLLAGTVLATTVLVGLVHAEGTCPEPTDILPCVCSVEEDESVTMDCSAVASEDELARIFSANFPSKSLNQLNIEDNANLVVLRKGVFGDVSFKVIQITSEVLEEVEEGALASSFPTCLSLTVASTALSSFPFSELASYQRLALLDLHGTRLDHLPPLSSPTLRLLLFWDNPAPHLTPDTFTDLPSLESCYFDYNNIQELQPGTFANMPALKEVSLPFGKVTHLPKGAVQLNGSHDDAKVELYGHIIRTIDQDAVTGLAGGTLMLHDNQITVAEETVFRPLMDGGATVYLSYNPLVCDCSLAWLVTSERYMTQLAGDETCYDGTFLANLDPQDFAEC